MTHPRHRRPDRLLTPGASAAEIASDYAAAPFDRIASEMEATWGVDRLPSLVSPELAAKYGRAAAYLNECLNEGDASKVAGAAANCVKGLHAMDAEARRLGHTPAPPDCWMWHDGDTRFVLIRDDSRWQAAQAAHPGLRIVTLREVANAIELRDKAMPAIEKVQAAFPGATVAAIRERSALENELEDEIPY
jgi:hypothetical protein